MIEDDGTSSERLKKSIKTPYPTDTEEGEKWNALLTILASEFDEHDQALADVRDAKFVNSASEEELEALAELFELNRQTNESIAEFRARVKVALRSQTTSATLSEIREMIAVLMGIDRAAIDLKEPDSEILTLHPRIPADAVGQSDVRPSYLNNLLTDVSAAGVTADSRFLAGDATVRIIVASTLVATMADSESAPIQVLASDVSAKTTNSSGTMGTGRFDGNDTFS